MTKPETRKLIDEAIAKGERFYFTGHPCVHGHISLRYVYNCTCVACIKMFAERHRRGLGMLPRVGKFKAIVEYAQPKFEPQAKSMNWQEILEYQKKNGVL